MKAAYAEYIGKLDPPSGADRETTEDVAAKMQNGGALLAWIGDKAVGSARFEFRGANLYVGRLAVVPALRGRGVAKAIMNFVESIARNERCEGIEILVRTVLEDNLRLYRNLGYSYEEIIQHPRAGRVTRMVKTLSPISDKAL